MMSAKQRLLCAIALHLENDRDKAEAIYRSLESNSDQYLLQGEVKGDLDLMKNLLNS